jgi:hypothetical protein
MLKTTTLLLAFAGATTAHAADLYFQDFETAGDGYTTSIAEFTDGGQDYFLRTDGSNINGNIGYVGRTGFFFGGQDIDGEGATLPVSLTTAAFSIAGNTMLQFSVDLAEDRANDNNQDWDALDSVRFEYAVDGGAWQEIFTAENDGSTFNSAAFIDGVRITDTFRAFSADLTGVIGDSMQVRLVWNLSDGDEDLAVDNIRVTGQTIAVVPLPPAAFAGLAMLGALGVARRFRR